MHKTKISYPLEILFKIVHEIKKEGKRVGLTHGAFDLFHYGHLSHIQQSSAICDYLIVGIEDDKRIAEYKDYRRPIITQKQRLNLINSIEYVDATFVKDIPFNIVSHVDLYKELKIDIVTIGRFFQYENAVEEQATKAGAKLVKILTDEGISTTSIIDAIIEKYSTAKYKEVPKEEC